MNSRQKQYLLFASLVIVGGGLVFILIETIKANNTGFETKTLWDWLELLIVPLFLAGGALYLERSERAVERQIAEDRTKEDRMLAEERANLEREIATDRHQEVALQAYLDRMAELLLKEKLRTSKNKEIRNVARIRTLTVLRVLDSKRKGLVLRFLQEASLINKNKLVVDLTGADLHGVVLHGANLEDADLQYTDLHGADLHSSILINTNLHGVDLSDANLNFAFLSRSQLISANLSNSNLHHAYMKDTNLSDAILINTNLTFADLERANLERATLEGVNLRGATMPDGTKHG